MSNFFDTVRSLQTEAFGDGLNTYVFRHNPHGSTGGKTHGEQARYDSMQAHMNGSAEAHSRAARSHNRASDSYAKSANAAKSEHEKSYLNMVSQHHAELAKHHDILSGLHQKHMESK